MAAAHCPSPGYAPVWNVAGIMLRAYKQAGENKWKRNGFRIIYTSQIDHLFAGQANAEIQSISAL